MLLFTEKENVTMKKKKKTYIRARLIENFEFIMELSDLIKEVFAKKVNRKTPPKLPNSNFVETKCWDWTGSCDDNGYGLFNKKFPEINIHVKEKAHRLAFVVYTGLYLPPGVQVNHICDNPACFNPDHLKLGSNGLNGQDKCNRYYTPKPFNETYKLGRLEKHAIRTLKKYSDFSNAQLASIFHVSVATIGKVLSKEVGNFTDDIGIEDPDYQSNYGNWTPEQTKQILQLIRKGIKYGDVIKLAKEMDIEISRLRKRITHLQRMKKQGKI
jgi:hypothetical protein